MKSTNLSGINQKPKRVLLLCTSTVKFHVERSFWICRTSRNSKSNFAAHHLISLINLLSGFAGQDAKNVRIVRNLMLYKTQFLHLPVKTPRNSICQIKILVRTADLTDWSIDSAQKKVWRESYHLVLVSTKYCLISVHILNLKNK